MIIQQYVGQGHIFYMQISYQCPRRNFKLKEEEEDKEEEDKKEEEEEEEEEEICKHGCTFIIYMVKKIGKKLEKEDF